MRLDSGEEPGPPAETSNMADEACRTRSQKRALEVTQNDIDNKKMKLEKECLLDGEIMIKADPGKIPGLLKSGEVKATIKVEVPTGDEPMDMSTSKSDIKREKRVPSPDVIVLSDNEPSSPRMNGLPRQKEPHSETFLLLQRSSPEERERIIKQLKEELRLEEAKLVLLKKLRQSQIQKETAPQKVPSRISGAVIPPPLVRGGQQVPSKQSTQIVMPPLVRGAQPISVSPQQIHSIRQHPGSGPPPLLLAPRASVPSVQMQGQRIIQQGLIRVANVANTNLLVNIPQASPTTLKGSGGAAGNATGISNSVNDSPASRQAAAKLALRKQLEKTLLEIPPPKPPAPELNFLPSAANNEFIYLVGLEEVVHNLLEAQGKTVQQTPSHEPYSCAQCKTDFTSRWRQEKNGTIMCDVCMTSNQKKALKAEHTNRLKAAFVKALQQEQEIEQRILQQSSSPAQIKTEHSVQHHTLKQSPTPISRGLTGTTRGILHTFPATTKLPNAATIGNRVIKPGERSMNKTNMAPGNWKKATAIHAGQTTSQRIIAAPQSKKQTVEMHRGGTLTFVNPALTVHKSAAVDRQREYLLDMIPSRSITQSSTWK